MESIPGPKEEFSLDRVLEKALNPALRSEARAALAQQLEDLFIAWKDVEKNLQKPGPDISVETWKKESSEFLGEMDKIMQAIAQVDTMKD